MLSLNSRYSDVRNKIVAVSCRAGVGILEHRRGRADSERVFLFSAYGRPCAAPKGSPYLWGSCQLRTVGHQPLASAVVGGIDHRVTSMQKIITCKEAIEQGLKRYFTGKPCKNGHISERRCCDRRCMACESFRTTKESRKRKGIFPLPEESKKKAKENNQWYYISIRPCPKGHVGRRQTLNGVCVKCAQISISERAKETNFKAVKDWGKRNKKKLYAYKSKYRKSEKGIISSRSHSSLRRKLKKNNSCENYSYEDIKSLESLQKLKCASCFCSIEEKYEIDHINPLSKGGCNCRKNIQLLCVSCNRRKHAKDPLDFARENGRLL